MNKNISETTNGNVSSNALKCCFRLSIVLFKEGDVLDIFHFLAVLGEHEYVRSFFGHFSKTLSCCCLSKNYSWLFWHSKLILTFSIFLLATHIFSNILKSPSRLATLNCYFLRHNFFSNWAIIPVIENSSNSKEIIISRKDPQLITVLVYFHLKC